MFGRILAIIKRRIRYRISTRNTIRFRLTLSMIAVFFISGLVIFHAVPEFTELLRRIALHKIDSDVASAVAKSLQPVLDERGSIADEMKVGDEFNEINPNVSMFLLDASGAVIDQLSLNSDAQRGSVSTIPIESRLKNGPAEVIFGDAVHRPLISKDAYHPFSVARVHLRKTSSPVPRGKTDSNPFEASPGYLYAMLEGSEYFARAQGVARENVLISQGAVMSIVAVVMPFLIMFLLIRNVLQRFRPIEAAMKDFRAGKFGTRIQILNRDEFGLLGASLNSIADSVERSILNLRNAEAYRKELVLNVADALGEPIQRIKAFSESKKLQAGREYFSEGNPLRGFDSSVEILESMLHELLQLSKLDTGDIVFQPELVSAGELISNVRNRFLPEALAKGLTLSEDVGPGMPEFSGDRLLLLRLLGNLVANAIRYTPSGGQVSVEARAEGESLVFRVRDSGIGIPVQNRKTIFDRYDRGAIGKDSLTGAGLGLAIAKRIVELHSGSIEVDSEEGKGTTFQFLLPCLPRSSIGADDFRTQPPKGE